MRLVQLVTLAGLNTLVFVMNAQTPDDPPDFALGRNIGYCLVGKCSIFRGSLLTDAPVPGRPVRIRVEEQIFGNSDGADTIDLTYQDPRAFVKSFDPQHAAWGAGGGVVFSMNGPVMAVMALEPIRLLGQGPILVTSNDSLFRKIRRVAAEGVRLETVPEAAIAEAVASLGRNRDGLLAGYLYAYLIQRMTVHSPDLEMSLLGQMIADHSVPTYALREITAEMGVQYFRLSTDGRTTVVRTFVDLAQRTDPQEAANGFVGLAQIEHFHDEVRNIIRPETMRKLAVIYRALVQRRSLSRNPPIEALLGIRE